MPKSEIGFSCIRNMISLQKMCLIVISTSLCNNQQLLRLISECIFFPNITYRLHLRKSKEWEVVRERADQIILKMCNSRILKEIIMESLWPVYYRIILWKFTYGTYKINEVLHPFSWTCRGRIDNITTAKHIIGNENIPIKERFRLACSLCLDKEIREMWCELSESEKIYFTKKNHDKFSPLTSFWARSMKGSVNVVEKYMRGALKCVISNGLLDAMKYLFSLLNEEKYLHISIRMGAFCLLDLNHKLSRNAYLDEDEIEIVHIVLNQIKLIEENIEIPMPLYRFLSLVALLHHPEETFLKVLEKALGFCCEHNIQVLLRYIFNMYHLEIEQDNDYRKLFIDVWRVIPEYLKNSVATQTDLGSYCARTLIRHDFPFLLSEEIIEEMTQFLSLNPIYGINLAPSDFSQDKWEFLLYLIDEGIATIPSTKMMSRFFNVCDNNALKRVIKFVHKFI